MVRMIGHWGSDVPDALKSTLLVAALTLGLGGCAQDMEFDTRSLSVKAELKPAPAAVPETRPGVMAVRPNAPVLSPSPQCLGQLSHPTYRRDLPPQPEKVANDENANADCEVENGVLYRFSSSAESGTRFAPGPDLHGIGI